MNAALIEWLPIGLFLYLYSFGFFIIALLFTGYICLKHPKNNAQVVAGLTALSAPLIGFFFYLTIDYFEIRGYQPVWWAIMMSIQLIPLVISTYFALKNEDKSDIK